jgi:malate dehydrogenase (oxaloacetate-decarboxylating)(NADP+)
MIKVLADGLPVGPILIGAARPAHILTPSVTARGVVNMTAVAVAEAQAALAGAETIVLNPQGDEPM